jgi:hypothetical protein
MGENKIVKRRGITLKTLQDAQRILRRVIDRAFAEGQELEYSGRIAQLMSVWVKTFELDKISDLEARLTELELKLQKK